MPRVLEPGRRPVSSWEDSRATPTGSTGSDADGNAYTLTAPACNNGQAYVAKLPQRADHRPGEGRRRRVADHVWWSRAGQRLRLRSASGHNLDIYLPELADAAGRDAGDGRRSSPVGHRVGLRLRLRHGLDGRWHDVHVAAVGERLHDAHGAESQHERAARRSTATESPGRAARTPPARRRSTGRSASIQPAGFLDDYTTSRPLRRQPDRAALLVLDRPGPRRPGWFIDDLTRHRRRRGHLRVRLRDDGGPDDDRVFNGGCKETTRVAGQCTQGWHVRGRLRRVAGRPRVLHGDARPVRIRHRRPGQNDRDPIAFQPGMLLVYTDEAHGYGNAGCDDPPGQSPLDSAPTPGDSTPELDDAAWTEAPGNNASRTAVLGTSTTTPIPRTTR